MFSLGTLIVALLASGCPSINKIFDSDSELEHNLNTNGQIFFMGNLNIYSRPFLLKRSMVEVIMKPIKSKSQLYKESTISILL